MRYLNIICTINQTGYGATRYMCMANINYGDQTLGEREVTCRANKHDTKKYIPNNYEKIYITSGAWIKWSNIPGQSACSAYTGLTNEVLPNLYLYIHVVGHSRKKIYRDADFFIQPTLKCFWRSSIPVVQKIETSARNILVWVILPFRENNIAVRYCINDLFLIKNVFLQVLSSCPSCCIINISFHPVRVMEYSWQDAFIYTCTPGYYWWAYPISKIGWEPGKYFCNRIWAAILYQDHIIIYTCIFLVY